MVLLCVGRLQNAWAKKMDMAEQTAAVSTTRRTQRSIRAFFSSAATASKAYGCCICFLVSSFFSAAFLNPFTIGILCSPLFPSNFPLKGGWSPEEGDRCRVDHCKRYLRSVGYVERGIEHIPSADVVVDDLVCLPFPGALL